MDAPNQGAPAPSSEPAFAILSTLVNDPAADTTAHDSQIGAAIVLGSGSNVVAAFTDSGSYVAGTSTRFTGFSRSTNGGTTWVDGGALPGNNDGGEPRLARDAVSGRVYLATEEMSPRNRVQIFRSDDDGTTWMAPVNGTPDGQSVFGPALAVDNFAGAGQGHVYVAFNDVTPDSTPDDFSHDVYLARSTDGGATFGPSGGIRLSNGAATVFGTRGASVVVGPDHAVYVFWWDRTVSGVTPSTIRMRKSTDLGLTFGAPVVVAPLTYPNATGRNGYPHAAVNPATGDLYVVHRDDGTGDDRGDVYFQQSSDGGATWSGRVRITDDVASPSWSESQLLPSLAVTPNGSRVFVGWHDRRFAPLSTADTEYWGVIGAVAGGAVTFGANFVVSDVAFPYIDYGQDPAINPDYDFGSDQVAADDTYFYVTWTDTRSANTFHANNPDIRLAKVPVSGPGGILRLATSSPGGLDEFATNDVHFTVVNRGMTTVTGISGTLTTSTPGVVIDDPIAAFPDLPIGASGGNVSPYRVRFTCAPGCSAPVNLVLTLTTSSDGAFTSTVNLPIFPRVSIRDVTLPEGTGSGSITAFNFTVSLSRPFATATRVNFSTANGTAVVPTFTASGPFTLPAGAPATTIGPASVYPIPIDVSGVTGALFGTAVKLNGLSHTLSWDLDLLLVNPAGQAGLIMSDVGGPQPATNVDVIVSAGPPMAVPLVSGTYAATNNGSFDLFPAPAPVAVPSGTYPTGVPSTTNPNGTWRIYASDDEQPGTGSLDSVSLIFSTLDSDFRFSSGQLVFQPGSTAQNVTVLVMGDAAVEPNETFVVNLSHPVNLAIGDGEGVGTIINDDGASLPSAAPDAFETSNSILTVSAPGVLANDNANGGGALSAVIATPPVSGALTLRADGGFTYTPAYTPVFDSFTYRALNANGISSPVRVSLTVSAVPAAPTAVSDTYTVSNLAVLSVPAPGVLTNDLSNGGGALSASLATTVGQGSLSFGTSGGFTYSPPSAFVGTTSFTYRAVNSQGTSNPATVTITVTGTPGPPTVANDAYSTAYRSALQIGAPGVLANDSTNGGGVMTASVIANPAHGTLALADDGGFSYTPAFGYAGTDSFTYRATNTLGAGGVGTVSISVAPPTTVQPPFNLRVESVVGNTVTLRWDSVTVGPQAAVFVLEGGLTPNQVLASIPTGSASPVFTFVAPTGSFFIRIHGQAGTFRSPASNEVPLHVNVPVMPSAPGSLLGLVNGSTLELGWKPTFGGGPPTGNVLEVTGAATAALNLGPTDRFQFSPVPGGSYTFRVRQSNAGGSGPPSGPVTLSFPVSCTGPPHAPINFLGYRIGSTAHVMWDPPAEGPAPTSYRLDVSGAFRGTIPTSARTLSGVVGSGTYRVRVQSVNACGSSAFTAEQDIRVP